MTVHSSDHDSSVSDHQSFPRSLDIATVSIYGLAILSGALFLFLPLVNLLHPSPWQRWIGAAHGTSNSHYENDSHESIALQCLKPLFYR